MSGKSASVAGIWGTYILASGGSLCLFAAITNYESGALPDTRAPQRFFFFLAFQTFLALAAVVLAARGKAGTLLENIRSKRRGGAVTWVGMAALATCAAHFSNKVWEVDQDFQMKMATHVGVWFMSMTMAITASAILYRSGRYFSANLPYPNVSRRLQIVVLLMMPLTFVRQDLIFGGTGVYNCFFASVFVAAFVLLAQWSSAEWAAGGGEELRWVQGVLTALFVPISGAAVFQSGFPTFDHFLARSTQGPADMLFLTTGGIMLGTEAISALWMLTKLNLPTIALLLGARQAMLAVFNWIFVERMIMYFLTPINLGSSVLILALTATFFRYASNRAMSANRSH